MNQLRQMCGLSVHLTNRVSFRGSSIARSAGSSGKDRRRPGDLLVAAGNGDDLPELKLSGRSYAKLIADYGREIEERSVAAKFNGDGKSGGTGAGFFSGTAFQRLARVSSLVKLKTGRNNVGPGLCTKSSSGPPVDPAKAGEDCTGGKAGQDGKDAVDDGTERAWLDKVVKAHRAKRANESRMQYCGEGRNVAHPLVQRIAKTTVEHLIGKARSNESVNVASKISPTKKKPDVPRSDTRNVSVVVKALKRSDKAKNASSSADSDDKSAMLVTLTEESNHSSTSSSHPLRHVDLRINGKPASVVDTLISKVEKLDFVSSAEKIEITIPVLSEATAGDKLRAPNSTINVCISSRGEEASRDSAKDVARSGDSGSGGPRSGLSHPSTFLTPKIRNFRKNYKFASRSRVVPWWTTEESFRRSESVPAGSAEDPPIVQGPQTKSSVLAASPKAAQSKEVASDSGTRAKPAVTEPSSPSVPRSDARNVSVVVKALKRSDEVKNASPMADSDDKSAMPVTLTEESNHSSTWWTTEESFRRSESVPAGSAEDPPIVQGPQTKSSVVAASPKAARSKEVASDSGTRAKPAVTEPGSPRRLPKSRRNGNSAISKIIEEESLKKSDSMPEADTRVKSTASPGPKKDAPSVVVGSPAPGKSVQARTPTPDNAPKKMSSPFAAASGEPKTECKSSESGFTGGNNNLSSAKDSGGGIHAKPISEMGAVRTKADTRGLTSAGQVSRVAGSDGVASKVGTKPLQEVSRESETNDAPRPGTHGEPELRPSTQSPAEPAKQPWNGRGASIKPNDGAAGRLSKAKNSAAAMRPIEKKKDGTLIDYGATVTTRKKPERKLSGSRSTNGAQRKKITGQEEPVVVATIKEVIPRRNRDVRGDAFNRKTEGSGQNGTDKNRRRTHVARDHCGSAQKKFNRISPKGTNEPNESGTPRTQLNKEKRNSEAANESQVVETVTADKKLLYSVWLRRFKERTGQDPDPTKDPKSRGG